MNEPDLRALRAELRPFVQRALVGVDEVAKDRQAILGDGAAFAAERVGTGRPARMVFICTHNSRRSHLGQVWALVAAKVFGVPGVESFSAGTEATACNHRTVQALERAGIGVAVAGEAGNPRYSLTYGAGGESVVCWSKTLEDDSMPEEDFAAMMCCGSADAACPVVVGASARVRLLYRDPKEADGSPEEAARYDERCLQIATEMMWMMREAVRRSGE